MVSHMSKSTILVILVATLLGLQVTSQPAFFSETCRSRMGKYTTNSTYERNLKSVLSNLQDAASTSSFSNTSAGSASNNKVFGQYYCRGDVDTELCHDCIIEAAQAVLEDCPNFKGAVIWYEQCTLRYQNTSMVGVESEVPSGDVWSAGNVTEPEKFGNVVNKTMDRIINKAAYGNASSFATGEGTVSRFETVYCLVQCSPDLNSTQCDTCLHSAYDLIPKWWSQFDLIFFPSCQLRYSMQKRFYQLPNAPPPMATAPSLPPSTTYPPPPPPPPPPAQVATTPPPPNGGSAMRGGRGSLNMELLISALAFALICLV